MDKKPEEIKQEFNQLFDINLNGNWEHFKGSLEEIKAELVGMSSEQIKALRRVLNDRLNKGLNGIDKP